MVLGLDWSASESATGLKVKEMGVSVAVGGELDVGVVGGAGVGVGVGM